MDSSPGIAQRYADRARQLIVEHERDTPPQQWSWRRWIFWIDRKDRSAILVDPAVREHPWMVDTSSVSLWGCTVRFFTGPRPEFGVILDLEHETTT